MICYVGSGCSGRNLLRPGAGRPIDPNGLGQGSMICRSHLVLRFETPVGKHYAFEQSLGQGGIGQVVQATCQRSNAKRAIKIMSRKSDPSGFEIALMIKLDHPNVLRLFETFEEPTATNTFLAIELCKGGPLPSYSKEFWPPLEEAAGAVIMWQLLGALHYLQSQSLSHGDICPANVLMLHFEKPPEQNVTKLIDFGAHAGSRTHDIPSAGLVMRALLGWCCGVKSSLREASSKAIDTFVYSEGGVAVPISKDASDLLNRFAGAERDSSFTAEKALKHNWFVHARRGEVPGRKAKPQRSQKPKDVETKTTDGKDKAKLKRAQTAGELSRDKSQSRSKDKDEIKSKDAKGKELSKSARDLTRDQPRVAPGGWWGAAPRLTNFIPRLRTFCNASGLLRIILVVAADIVDEEVLAPLRAAFQRMDGWCPDGLLTVEDLKHRLPKLGCKDVPADLDRLLIEADVDGVGALDFTTFIAITIGSQEVLSTDLGAKTFKILDRDQDGTISANDLLEFLKKVFKAEGIKDLLQDAVGKKPLNFQGFLGLLTKASKMETDFTEQTSTFHRLSPDAVSRMELAMATCEGSAHPIRSEAIKAKRRIIDTEAQKRRKEDEQKRRKQKREEEKKAKQRRKKEPVPEPDETTDPLTLSLIIQDSSDGSDSGRSQSQSVSQASRGRTDTGDTVRTVDTVGTVNSMGSVDSTTVTMKEFDEILRNNSRLMVTL
eukprot:s151_g4.t1